MSLRMVETDCRHEHWFRHEFAPEPGETIWCKRCEAYTLVGPVLEETLGTYYPDCEWTAFRQGKIVKGVCANCQYVFESWAFNIVRTKMERHHYRKCVEYGILREINNPFLLPPNSPAPF